MLKLFLIQNELYWQNNKDVPPQAEVAQGVPGKLRLRIFLTFRHYKGGVLTKYFML